MNGSIDVLSCGQTFYTQCTHERAHHNVCICLFMWQFIPNILLHSSQHCSFTTAYIRFFRVAFPASYTFSSFSVAVMYVQSGCSLRLHHSERHSISQQVQIHPRSRSVSSCAESYIFLICSTGHMLLLATFQAHLLAMFDPLDKRGNHLLGYKNEKQWEGKYPMHEHFRCGIWWKF
jgi:hypothetical protein